MCGQTGDDSEEPLPSSKLSALLLQSRVWKEKRAAGIPGCSILMRVDSNSMLACFAVELEPWTKSQCGMMPTW